MMSSEWRQHASKCARPAQQGSCSMVNAFRTSLHKTCYSLSRLVSIPERFNTVQTRTDSLASYMSSFVQGFVLFVETAGLLSTPDRDQDFFKQVYERMEGAARQDMHMKPCRSWSWPSFHIATGPFSIATHTRGYLTPESGMLAVVLMSAFAVVTVIAAG